jgi:hypothetical protein
MSELPLEYSDQEDRMDALNARKMSYFRVVLQDTEALLDEDPRYHESFGYTQTLQEGREATVEHQRIYFDVPQWIDRTKYPFLDMPDHEKAMKPAASGALLQLNGLQPQKASVAIELSQLEAERAIDQIYGQLLGQYEYDGRSTYITRQNHVEIGTMLQILQLVVRGVETYELDDSSPPTSARGALQTLNLLVRNMVEPASIDNILLAAQQRSFARIARIPLARQ